MKTYNQKRQSNLSKCRFFNFSEEKKGEIVRKKMQVLLLLTALMVGSS